MWYWWWYHRQGTQRASHLTAIEWSHSNLDQGTSNVLNNNRRWCYPNETRLPPHLPSPKCRCHTYIRRQRTRSRVHRRQSDLTWDLRRLDGSGPGCPIFSRGRFRWRIINWVISWPKTVIALIDSNSWKGIYYRRGRSNRQWKHLSREGIYRDGQNAGWRFGKPFKDSEHIYDIRSAFLEMVHSVMKLGKEWQSIGLVYSDQSTHIWWKGLWKNRRQIFQAADEEIQD